MFQSTRPVRGATTKSRARSTHITVSIHAPREGRDALSSKRSLELRRFNPRAP